MNQMQMEKAMKYLRLGRMCFLIAWGILFGFLVVAAADVVTFFFYGIPWTVVLVFMMNKFKRFTKELKRRCMDQ